MIMYEEDILTTFFCAIFDSFNMLFDDILIIRGEFIGCKDKFLFQNVA